ncbi:endolytic transglycosylase MltG [Rhodopila sp.]|uniref:endolytic transglycosylase MltG n=1 Tax=Rhodopila sp. TaxID=2480087 RepID=UPI003D130F06
MKRWFFLCALVVLAMGAGVGVSWWKTALRQSGPLAEARAIIVPHGGTAKLAADLAADGLIARPIMFRAAAWLTQANGALHAAELEFPAHASIDQVLAILRTARPVEHHVTIAEGLTARQIEGVLAQAEAATGAVGSIEEGSVLPQTYDYEYGTARSAIIARATAAMDKDLAAVWAGRAAGLPLASSRDALILASIVERETAKPEERPHVAAVYLNRLRQGMKLQADPTVVYLASGGAGVLDRPLTKTELGRDDPFNTYRSRGLPPGPICSPSLESLNAVVHPAASDDLFLVADGTGGHVFSHGLEAHAAAVAHWRALAPSAPHARPD